MTKAANPMTADGATQTPAGPAPVTPIPATWVARLLATAARAPSVHNTQPWRFSVTPHAIELYADPGRKVHQDAIGRQMLISCGAALFGLRLAVRELGRVPAVTLLPDPGRPALLARVALGPEAPATELERRMLAALPHRHTHRGAFDPGPLPGCCPACSMTPWPRAPCLPSSRGPTATRNSPPWLPRPRESRPRTRRPARTSCAGAGRPAAPTAMACPPRRSPRRVPLREPGWRNAISTSTARSGCCPRQARTTRPRPRPRC